MEEQKLHERAHTDCKEYIGIRVPKFLKQFLNEQEKSTGIVIREKLYELYLEEKQKRQK